MQITFDRAALETALRAPSRIAARNHAATDDVFMEAAADRTVRLTTTDAQTWLATTLTAETDGTGVLLVPAEPLLNYIRGLAVERITLNADTAGHAALVWASNHLRLLCRDPEQFPEPPSLTPDAPAFTLPAALLQTLGRWDLPVAQDVGERSILVMMNEAGPQFAKRGLRLAWKCRDRATREKGLSVAESAHR